MKLLLALLTGLVALALIALWLRQRTLRRQRTLARLLDRADELERLLHRIRERMTAMRQVVERVPADIGAVAQASLDRRQQVNEALRDVLEHRLWIQRHGDDASQSELDIACAALERARDRLADELDRLERAGAELTEATDAAVEAAAREPASLRRQAPD